MEIFLFAIFVFGYIAITFEHSINVNKAATSLATGTLCWAVYALWSADIHTVNHQLEGHFSEISGILFFLLGAMTIVELIDAHDGFDIITERIKTTNKKRLLWMVSLIAFFLSALLDNLTTTIVMVSLLRKLIDDREDRMLFAGIVVIAANAGGAWSPIGDVTTTMLWIGGQISALNVVKMLFLPSLVCLAVPVLIATAYLKGRITVPKAEPSEGLPSTDFERKAVFFIGLGALLLVPVFKTFTHLPPYLGMMLMLGLVWIITEFIHSEKDESEKGTRSVLHALRKIDTPSILFFLGILLAVAALQSAGMLSAAAAWLDRSIGNLTITGLAIGLLSAIVDNVPLVAATQGMYTLQQYPMDHFFWEFLAYCTGTGGSVLIIGSAAGVAAMGLEKIEFFWYLKRVSFLALAGYLSGAAVYLLQNNLMHG